MQKNYIRKQKSLTVGGGSTFECKKCPKKFERKDEFKKHFEEKHITEKK